MNKNDKIYVTGHSGLVGSAIVRELERQGYTNIITHPHKRDYDKYCYLDLREQNEVEGFFSNAKPDYVFNCAAKVGGVFQNSQEQADFLYDNLAISTNIIRSAFLYKVKGLLNLGSVCIYPKTTPQPIKEEYLLTGELEPTNEGYAIAKIAALKLCQKYNEQYDTNFMSVMPTNIYGPYDISTHVIPDLVRKFRTAKLEGQQNVTLYGTGIARREFLHADDLAEVCVKIMNCGSSVSRYTGGILNIGSGSLISIGELAALVKKITGYKGAIVYDSGKPDGAPIRQLDCTKLQSVVDWRPKISLEDGIQQFYSWFLTQNN